MTSTRATKEREREREREERERRERGERERERDRERQRETDHSRHLTDLQKPGRRGSNNKLDTCYIPVKNLQISQGPTGPDYLCKVK